MSRTFFNKAGTAEIKDGDHIGHPDRGGKIFEYGATVPTDGATGYAKGCIFIHSDGSTTTTILYVNIGTSSSCNFNAVTIASD